MVPCNVFSGPADDHDSSSRGKLYSIGFIRYLKTPCSCPHGALVGVEDEALISKATIVFHWFCKVSPGRFACRSRGGLAALVCMNSQACPDLFVSLMVFYGYRITVLRYFSGPGRKAHFTNGF